MTGYTKLFPSIVHSTVWRAPNATRLVWITMLALADRDGQVEASLPGLADAARVSLDECTEALQYLQQPDPWSRTKDFQGRRIVPTDGGWLLLNHEKYRRKLDAEDRKTRAAERQKRHRDRRRDVTERDSNAASRDVTEVTTKQRAAATSSATAEAGSPSESGTLTYSPPDDWTPNASHRGRCLELSIDLEREAEAFRLYEFRRPIADWDRRFSLWLHNAYAQRGNAPARRPGARDGGALERQAQRIEQLRAEEVGR
jgi:hypothetical protein